MKQKKASLFWLFGINLMISAFTFGGGYVVVPMIRKYYVEQKQLFDEKELADLAAIAQTSPGAIAINLTALAGYRTAGMKGAVVSCLAAVIPPMVILSVVSLFYAMFQDNRVVAAVLKGMEAGVCALIVDVVWDMSTAVFREKNPLFAALLPLSFAAVFLLHANVLLVIGISAAVCFAAGWLRSRKGENDASAG